MFLLEQIKLKKHQVVLTSHSPSIVKDLPKEAIEVFFQNPNNGRFIVQENLTPKEAFYHIEYPHDTRKNIIVEDFLAKEIIESVLDKLGVATRNLFNVKFNPGGESVIKREFIPVFCREVNSRDFVLFDGDQRPDQAHFDWRSFASSELTVNFLKQKIQEQAGEEIKFSVDGRTGAGNQDQQLELLKSYLDYFLQNVYYLPQNIPEQIIWDNDVAEQLIRIGTESEAEFTSKYNEVLETESFKHKYSKVASITQNESNSESIASVHKIFLKKWLSRENEDFNSITEVIMEIANHG